MTKEIASLDRRTFMRRGAMGAGGLWALSLQELSARGQFGTAAGPSPYGPVSPKLDGTTGLPLIQLPDGFRYLTYGWTGDPMSDGIPTPSLHDGMAVVDNYGGNPNWLVLVRNHEPDAGGPYLTKPDITYRNDGAGGTTNLVFDIRRGRFQKSWSTLAGTIRNCAGGVTPWNTWLTCEETGVAGHGWTFEVNGLTGDPTPLTALGRFSHEADMIDPDTGYIYQTEDAGTNSGFYKFVPYVYGDLKQGGELYMAKVKNLANANLGTSYTAGTTWDIEWVRVDDPLATTQSTFGQGFAKGGARFRRLEGAWWSVHSGYFLATEGGGTTQGQVFEYNPLAETITLIYESPSADDCDNPDNLVVTPRGGLILCEDNATAPQYAPGERLLGLTLTGTTFDFAINNVVLTGAYNNRVGAGDYRQNEWAGACYSPDGNWLFANIQTPGITFAITGPWGAGPL